VVDARRRTCQRAHHRGEQDSACQPARDRRKMDPGRDADRPARLPDRPEGPRPAAQQGTADVAAGGQPYRHAAQGYAGTREKGEHPPSLVPEARTGSAMGLLGTMSAVGRALGPSVGGVLAEALGWQAVFLADLPLEVGAGVGLHELGEHRSSHGSHQRARPRARRRGHALAESAGGLPRGPGLRTRRGTSAAPPA
jgi:hypothetical protein